MEQTLGGLSLSDGRFFLCLLEGNSIGYVNILNNDVFIRKTFIFVP